MFRFLNILNCLLITVTLFVEQTVYANLKVTNKKLDIHYNRVVSISSRNLTLSESATSAKLTEASIVDIHLHPSKSL